MSKEYRIKATRNDGVEERLMYPQWVQNIVCADYNYHLELEKLRDNSAVMDIEVESRTVTPWVPEQQLTKQWVPTSV